MEMFYIRKAFNYDLKKPKEQSFMNLKRGKSFFQSSLNEKVIKGDDQRVQIAHR